MTNEAEGIDERLRDGTPPPLPADVVYWAKLVHRYGIMAICNYPQILFEGQNPLPPDYRHRIPSYAPSGDLEEQRKYEAYRSLPGRLEATLRVPIIPYDPLGRLRAAYSVLDEIFAASWVQPVPQTPSSEHPSTGLTSRYGPG